jgi:hypothetical protein
MAIKEHGSFGHCGCTLRLRLYKQADAFGSIFPPLARICNPDQHSRRICNPRNKQDI